MTQFPETNEMLIARVKDLGDSASWSEFVGIYHPAILRMAKRRGMQEADAMDVIQQVFVSVAKSIESWSPVSGGPPFRAWLATIARNAITNALARKPVDAAYGGSSFVSHLQSLPAQSSLAATRSELIHETKHQAVLWAADQIRGEFNNEVWQCFWMTAIEGKTVAEVATALDRSPGSIYVARYRVVARLKEKVQDLSQAWDD